MDMEYTALGRTGLKVSVMGLGSGGHSRLGQGPLGADSPTKSEAESARIVRRAIDLGVNFIDTGAVYGTEEIVGRGIKGLRRDEVVISTKSAVSNSFFVESEAEVVLKRPAELIEKLERSLRRLGTDYVDVYHLHGVRPEEYNYSLAELYPALLQARDEGKIRFVGITESFNKDPRHQMLQMALSDDCWDVVMVGFNMLNQGARHTVFPLTIEKEVGVLVMFAVRRALSSPEVLRELVAELKERGLVAPSLLQEDDPLGFLVHRGEAISLVDAAYRYCRYEPGVHVVLSGTGRIEHLEQNVESMLRPPLPRADRLRLEELFARVESVTGN